MIIVRTPVRISLLGGGTDYPSWYSLYGGLCIGGAINKYSYVQMRYLPPYHDFRSRLVYSEIETVNSCAEVQHRALKACLEHTGYGAPDGPGLEITHSSDLPARTGTGSSSAFVCGVLKGLYALKDINILPEELATEAIYVEQKLMGETVGDQDQTWAAHGGLNRIAFNKDGTRIVTPLMVSAERLRELESHICLIYTGITRTASDIAKEFVPNLPKKSISQHTMMKLANDGEKAIRTGAWKTLGGLIDRAWRLKTQLSDKVNTEHVHKLYTIARISGAVGGKLIGAGGGGCLLLIVDPDRQPKIIGKMEEEGAVYVPVKFDFQGASIVYADTQNLSHHRS